MASSSIAIPSRRQPSLQVAFSSSDSTSSSPSSYEVPRTPMRSKGKQRAVESPVGSVELAREYSLSARRPSLLGSSLSKSEYTVINLSHSESSAPRLVTCVKSSQGFNWNQELFLPSYIEHDHDLEHRPDPIEDIILTDEEAAALLPQ